MAPGDRDWAGNVEQTEAFFYQFFAYIFHTAEGRRMRGIFLRESIMRTLLYLLIAVPLVIILWYGKMVSSSPTLNFCAGILLFNLVFGLAFLRTVYRYRARVKIVYKMYFGGNKEDDKPEAPPPDTDLDSIFAQLANPNDAAPIGNTPLPNSNEETAMEMSATFKCARCQCEVIVPMSEIDTTTTCPCGGKLVQT